MVHPRSPNKLVAQLSTLQEMKALLSAKSAR
jgi:hypothetical protein